MGSPLAGLRPRHLSAAQRLHYFHVHLLSFSKWKSLQKMRSTWQIQGGTVSFEPLRYSGIGLSHWLRGPGHWSKLSSVPEPILALLLA